MPSMKLLAAVTVLTIATAVPAGAQTRPVTPQKPPARPFVEHGFITLMAGPQVETGEISDRLTFTANAEEGSIDAAYPKRTGVLVDGTVGFRVRRQLGIAVGVTRTARTGEASVSARIPHPFFDNQHRAVEGSAADISRNETAVHLQLYYDLLPKGPWRIRLFGGPSFFDVEQELVTSVQAAEAYPYDTAEFRSTATERATGSAAGFNAGIDLSRMFTRRVGLGALVRYAHGSVDLNVPDSRTVSTDGGGFQAAAGLRVLF